MQQSNTIKTKLIIIGAGLFLIVIIVGITVVKILSRNFESSPDIQGNLPSITLAQRPSVFPTVTPSQNTTAFVASIPDKAIDVATTSAEITIKLNSKVDLKTEVFTIEPNVPFAYITNNKTMYVTFLEPLQPSQIYSYGVIKEGRFLMTGSFTTSGPTPTPGILVNTDNVFQEMEKRTISEHPDFHVHNQLPHETRYYSISSRFVEQPTSHYVFTVTAKTQLLPRADVEKWILSLGISEAQLKLLKIEYK